MFFVKVNGLDHFKTGNSDEAIERNTNSAENAAGNGVDKSYEGAEESKKNGKKSRGSDSYDGSVFSDCNTTYGFAVSGVGAATEECACHGTYAVAEEGFVKTGFSKKIAFDDGRNVFVVSNMFSKNNECNGRRVRVPKSARVIAKFPPVISLNASTNANLGIWKKVPRERVLKLFTSAE